MSDFNVTTMSLEDLVDLETPATEELPGTIQKDETPEVKKEEPKKVESVKEPLEEKKLGTLSEDELAEETEIKEEPIKEKAETPKKKEEPKASKSLKDSIDYNAYYDSLVKEGLWKEVNLKDDAGVERQLSAEDFQTLSLKQAEWKAEDVLSEREAEFGTQYKELTEHLKNGGKVEDLAQSYQQQIDVESIDITNPDGAEQVIETYCESMGWSSKRTKNYINDLKDKGEVELKEVAQESQEALVTIIKEDREQVKKNQEIVAKRNKDYTDRFTKALKESIHKDEVPDREKRDLERFYFDYKHQLENGKASDFYLKYEEIRNDPQKWFKLVKFVKDFDQFEDKTKTANKIKKDTFNLIRTGEVITKKGSEFPEESKKEDKVTAPETFKKFFQKV